MLAHSAMVKPQKAMDMEFNDQRMSKKPKQLVGEIKPAESTVAIDEHVAAKQSLLKDAKAAYTKVTKVIDEALTATVTWQKLMGEGKLEHANPRVLNKVQDELVKALTASWFLLPSIAFHSHFTTMLQICSLIAALVHSISSVYLL